MIMIDDVVAVVDRYSTGTSLTLRNYQVVFKSCEFQQYFQYLPNYG